MHYTYLGKLPDDTIKFFKEELLKLKIDEKYQYIHFNNFLYEHFLKIFNNTNLSVRKYQGRLIQKGFYTEPGYASVIHKDGIDCKAALNVSLSSNDTDWVRWYDDETINKIANTQIVHERNVLSRDTGIFYYDEIPYIDEYKPKTGDVYVINTDIYHGFKCSGPDTRLIVQTKFTGNPNFESLSISLKEKSFINLWQGC